MKTIVALYPNSSKAANVVRDLLNAGIPRDEISVMAHNRDNEFGAQVRDHTIEQIADAETEPDEHVDAASGAGIGLVEGSVLGILAGIGALAIPGIGPIIAAGPLTAALIGGGAGALTGGIVGALTDAGVDDDAEYFAEALRRGNAVVVVRSDDALAEQAAAVLYRHAPIDLDEQVGQWREEGWEGFDHHGDPYFPTVDDVLVTGEMATDEPSLDSANVPDLDEESRAYMTNLDSDSTGSITGVPEQPEAAIPNEERHPGRTPQPDVKEAVGPGGQVRVYGVDPD